MERSLKQMRFIWKSTVFTVYPNKENKEKENNPL